MILEENKGDVVLGLSIYTDKPTRSRRVEILLFADRKVYSTLVMNSKCNDLSKLIITSESESLLEIPMIELVKYKLKKVILLKNIFSICKEEPFYKMYILEKDSIKKINKILSSDNGLVFEELYEKW